MTMKSSTLALLLVAAIALPGRALAVTITLTPTNASASLTSATSGKYGAKNGTQSASDVGTQFGGTWTSAGQRTSDGTSSSLTIDVTSGNWGSKEVSGTWAIAPSFWTTYSSAIISMHVGGNDDSNVTWFDWVITPSQTSGTWRYENEGNGGGLSNMQLWGSGQGSSNTPGVPDSGSTLALMGLALVGLGFVSRKSSRR